MNNIFKNKFLLIFILFTLLLSLFYTPSFGRSAVGSNGVDINIPDSIIYNYPYFIIYGVSSNQCYLVYSTSPFSTYTERRSTGAVVRYFSPSDSSVCLYRANIYFSSTGFHYYDLPNDISSLPTSTFYSEGCPVSDDIHECHFSSFDIYKRSSDELVFQASPLEMKVTIPAIQEVKEIPQAMGKVLTMIIPIGLIIFGIGLVISLILYSRSRLM